MTPDEANVFIGVIAGALTQLGIPAVFVWAWWQERTAHLDTIRAHTRDLRRCAGMALPEDVVSGD